MKYLLVAAAFCVALAVCTPFEPLFTNIINKEKEILNHTFDRNAIEESLKHFNKLDHKEYKPNMLNNLLPGYGKTWMLFPGGDNKPRIVDLTNIKIGHKSLYDIEKSVTFHLYTRNNVYDSQVLTVDMNSFKNSNYNFSNNVKFITHGWISSYTDDVCQKVKNAWLKSEDVNIICVDWLPIAKELSYFGPAYETKNVGRYVAKMLDFLVDNGVKSEDLHILGWSLGSHVMGTAGYYFSKGKVGRITGFDPARPAFEPLAPREDKLDSSDAAFVDIIHTCAGVLGYLEPHGHVDFFPNAGLPPQPGCVGIPQATEACSHSRSYEYFAEALENRDNFVAVECPNMVKYKLGACKNNKIIPLGPKTPTNARGVYMLNTNHQSPFARGNPFKDEKLISLIQNPRHL